MNFETMSLEELRSLFYLHNDKYYKGVETISDSDFDRLFNELSKREEQLPPQERLTSRVNSEKVDDDRGLIIHGAPMLSIKTVTDITFEGFTAFDKGVRNSLGLSEKEPIEYICEAKYDGLGLNLKYEKGILMNMSVRGDGLAGQRVSQSWYLYSESIPKRLKVEFTGEIRGEGMMSKTLFKTFNDYLLAKGEEPKKNPRNAVAGVTRASKEYEPLFGQLLFLPYSVPVSNFEFKSQQEVLRWLEMNGFKLNKDLYPLVIPYPGSQLTPYSFYKGINRDALDIEIDGVVYKVNNLEQQAKLGFREREPRWAMAHKFAPQEVWTTFLGYGVTVGRTGVLTVVAKLAPVNVGGVTVESCILEHFFHIRKLGIRVGDMVKIKRAGDTIPKLVEGLGTRPSYVPNIRAPHFCPHCDGPIIRKKGFKEHFCVNKSCPGRLLNTLIYFVSRPCMDIVGLGEKIVEGLFKRGYVRYPDSIYRLSYKEVSEIAGDANATKIMDQIQKSRSVEDWKLLTSIGIPGIGPSTAKKICKEIDITDLMIAKEKDILSLKVATSEPHAIGALVDYLFEERETPLSELVETLEYEITKTTGSFVKQKGRVVITGSFHKKRTELAKELELKGWKVLSDATSTTDYVVIGDGFTQHKVDTAKKLGKPVMGWEEFSKLL